MLWARWIPRFENESVSDSAAIGEANCKTDAQMHSQAVQECICIERQGFILKITRNVFPYGDPSS